MTGHAVTYWPGTDLVKGFRSVDGADDLVVGEVYAVGTPSAPVLPAPSAVELRALAKEKRDLFLANAANRIGPLQDALDMGRATGEEAARLLLWKEYRIDLNRIETQESFPLDIQWPISPDDALTD